MSIESAEQKNNRQIAYWLIACAVVIFGMVILGGATRLTNSGLSMVEWKPLMGVIPPLSEADWQETFEKYKQFPEYKKINIGMDLHGFKKIFLYEYAHRVLGRLIGLMFFIPFVYFLIRRQVSKPLVPKLIALFVLGGLQGLMGWYMVKSGLVDNPHVSQYRLTAHLALAVIIYAYMLWVAWGLLLNNNVFPLGQTNLSAVKMKWLARGSISLTSLVFIMILSGALVAGTRAGYAFNTFPLMGDTFIPQGLFSLQPFWLNFFENIVTIQFDHRILAYIIFVSVIAFSVFAIRMGVSRFISLSLYVFIVMLMIQLILGVSTLLMHVPVGLGVAHQGGAILLLTASLFVTFILHKEVQRQV